MFRLINLVDYTMKKKVLKIKDVHISLILHNVRSCYNVGSIFRTADAAGVDVIYLCGYTPTPDKDIKISKTALGAEKTIKWELHKVTWRLLRKLHENGVRIIALERFDKFTAKKLRVKNIFEYSSPVNQTIAIMTGHERKGLSKRILEYVDDIVEIPMHGKKESLNVSVAVGIAVYSLINKRVCCK